MHTLLRRSCLQRMAIAKLRFAEDCLGGVVAAGNRPGLPSLRLNAEQRATMAHTSLSMFESAQKEFANISLWWSICAVW